MKKLIFSLIISALLCFIPKSHASVDFDGADDFINLGDRFYSDDFTICAWINVDTFGTKYIVVKRNDASDPPVAGSNEYELRVTSGNTILIAVYNSGAAVGTAVSDTALSVGVWYHVCGTVAAGTTGALDIYVNGVDDNADADVKSNTVSNTTDQIQIGARAAGNDTRWFDGRIEGVLFSNNVLTASEIASLYNSKRMYAPLDAALVANGVVLYYPLNDGSDGTASCFNGVAGYRDVKGNQLGTGRDGANNTGLTCRGTTVLTYD